VLQSVGRAAQSGSGRLTRSRVRWAGSNTVVAFEGNTETAVATSLHRGAVCGGAAVAVPPVSASATRAVVSRIVSRFVARTPSSFRRTSGVIVSQV